jgi:putative heme-binding domain-containing protein
LVRSQAANRRIAAEVAGRCGTLADFDALLATFANPREEDVNDRFLDHSLLFGMMEIAAREREALVKRPVKLNVRKAREAQALLTVLDHVQSDQLRAADVIAALSSENASLRQVAFWLLRRHAEWGDALAKEYRQRLAKAPSDALARELAELSRMEPIQQLLAAAAMDAQATAETHQAALIAMRHSSLAQPPARWLEALGERMAQDQGAAIVTAVETARAVAREKPRSEKLDRALLAVAGDAQFASQTRLIALAALWKPALTPALLALVRREVGSETADQRTLAADVLAKAVLSDAQLVALAGDLRSAGPLQVDAILSAAIQSKDDEVGRALVASLAASSLRDSLPVGVLRERLKHFGPAVQADAEKLYAQLDAASAGQKERLEGVLASLPQGDVRRGQQVFHSAKALCSQCHAIGYAGGRLGPDLTRIGLVRTERDLLESLLFPSNSFVQGFEPSEVVTTDGRVLSGIFRKSAGGEATLHTGPNQAVRLTEAEIESVVPGKVSVMPAGLDQQLTQQQLADLVAYLKSCR